ncbi:Ankyrin-1 [Fusarium oxysporum f. sp. albedinis]|nr:Uncharacterized protein HZ326_25390 [Fusarium oxysporum f. sp. albedinis]KAJ0131874.1 Ankyrin-1 [Fusarium oxysporum f. sp. albedinis]
MVPNHMWYTGGQAAGEGGGSKSLDISCHSIVAAIRFRSSNQHRHITTAESLNLYPYLTAQVTQQNPRPHPIMAGTQALETRPPVPTFPVEELQGALPEAVIDDEIDHEAIASASILSLPSLSTGMLSDNPIWRDLFVLTGTLRTFHGEEIIVPVWQQLSRTKKPIEFAFVPGSSKVVRLGETYAWIQAKFTFNVAGPPECVCSGYIGLVPESESNWKIWLLTTMLEKLQAFPSPDSFASWRTQDNVVAANNNGVQDAGLSSTGHSTTATRTAEALDNSHHECVTVGAGFSGLCVAGRLKAMGVSCLILESNPKVGDTWLNRYETVRYHTSKYFSDFPVESIFAHDYPYYLEGKDLARGFQEYVDKMRLVSNVLVSSTLESGTLDKTTNTWTLNINHAGNPMSITASHIVLATGIGNKVPLYPNMENEGVYGGMLLHSADYKTARSWKGKSGVVIGTANTGKLSLGVILRTYWRPIITRFLFLCLAHDVASDMLAAGLKSVTMVQRGRTRKSLFPYDVRLYSAALLTYASSAMYHLDCDTEESDRDLFSIPLAILRKQSLIGSKPAVDSDHERFDALERRGFRVERYIDLWKCMCERNGGHYQDVGCSAKIAAGLIKIKSDARMTGYTPTGLVFTDGSRLDADVIVFCTGYVNDIRKQASQLFGHEIGNQLDDLWGVDSEGELRGVFKPTPVPGLWFHGGGVSHSRFYSRFLALQIKAALAGTPLNTHE